MESENVTFVMLPKEEWTSITTAQKAILDMLNQFCKNGATGPPVKHITAKEFMATVRIGRTKFSELVKANKIKYIKKRRKIYLPISEIERFFCDQSVC